MYQTATHIDEDAGVLDVTTLLDATHLDHECPFRPAPPGGPIPGAVTGGGDNEDEEGGDSGNEADDDSGESPSDEGEEDNGDEVDDEIDGETVSGFESSEDEEASESSEDPEDFEDYYDDPEYDDDRDFEDYQYADHAGESEDEID